MPSRRNVLVTTTGTLAALAGCTSQLPGTPPERSPPTETPPADPGKGRPTATSRDPEPLDVSGSWPQRGNGPGHGGVTGATGVPDSGRVSVAMRSRTSVRK